MTKRVPIWAPAAPIRDKWAIILPVAMPPATKIGTWGNSKRISCSNTMVETWPMWPPASLPSRISASAP